jgi:hypothetical protein
MEQFNNLAGSEIAHVGAVSSRYIVLMSGEETIYFGKPDG